MRECRILGMMSGSSLDGVDLALCQFRLSDGPDLQIDSWDFESLASYSYSESWQQILMHAAQKSLSQLLQTDGLLGQLYGDMANTFLQDIKGPIDAVALHGHTVIHQPESGCSLQLGAGASLAQISQRPAITQFRDADILAGGQGAPLAPLADQLLFPGYSAYLNIGGISNCYLPKSQEAFDTGGANQLLNNLAQQLGRPYDDGGQIAASGKVLPDLLLLLEKLPYFQQKPPKSLSNQWVQEAVWPLIHQFQGSIPDKLHTTSQHIAWHIAESLKQESEPILVSGGGARNHFLIQLIRERLGDVLFLPSSDIIDFKEAALVALLGLHRLLNIPAPLKDLTGARSNAVPGALYLPTSKC
ncbi:MAG: anhydro-N-acetylmuramic acid kinase [Saprospiraceae bacterium]|nr:anhydro-N-acetylmuramic acid kinase [Saprospiraceae bacterium]